MIDAPWNVLVILLFCLAGAAWRFIDGLSRETSGIRTGWRNAGTVALAVAAAWVGGLGWWAPWAGGWMAAALIVGETKWESWTWQAIRFGGPAAVAVLPLGMDGLPYVVAAAGAGLAYPALATIGHRLPRFWLFDGFEAYARLALGLAVIGGLAGLGGPF